MLKMMRLETSKLLEPSILNCFHLCLEELTAFTKIVFGNEGAGNEMRYKGRPLKLLQMDSLFMYRRIHLGMFVVSILQFCIEFVE